MNMLSADGWLVVAVAAADRGTWFGALGASSRQELVVFPERTVAVETPVKMRESSAADTL